MEASRKACSELRSGCGCSCLRGGFGEKISEVRRETYAALSPLSLSLNTVPSNKGVTRHGGVEKGLQRAEIGLRLHGRGL
jgi:hypothetical protein